MEWLQITVTTTTLCADIVSMLLLDAGSEGVSVVDKSDIENVLKSEKSWDYVDDSLLHFDDERVFVSGFFPRSFNVAALSENLRMLKEKAVYSTGSLETACVVLQSADWENEWKKYYEPIEIGDVVIVPKWLKYAGEKTQVRMDPGMAFGTGKHETTSMCVALLQQANVKDKFVADVGCGSGILGITALKLGAKRCVMSDIDEQAVKAATENAALNGVLELAEITCGDLTEKMSAKVDVVVANITADVLLRLKDSLGALSAKGGRIIISGLIHSRADEVCEAYAKNFTLLKRLKEGEWQAMLFENV